MKIAILYIGHLSVADNPKNPPSYIRFERGIGLFLNAKWTVFKVLEGSLPDNAHDFDGYLITGGDKNVPEHEPWQAPLIDFIGVLEQEKIPLVGICYGHQVIAYALGGRVEPAKQGYGAGIKDNKLIHRPDWMQYAPEIVSLYSMHKQQVTQLPHRAKLFLTSDFCPQAGFVVGNHILAMQQHPDFNAAVSRELIEKRREQMIDVADDALQSLTRPHHTELSCQWIADFFKFRDHCMSELN